MTDDYIDKIMGYFYAAMHLYGVISVDELYDAYVKENEEDFYHLFVLLNKEKTFPFFEYKDAFYLSFYEDKKDFLECLKTQKGKSLCILPRGEFVKYRDWDYYQKNEYTDKLVSFMKNNLHISNAEKVMTDAMTMISFYNTMPSDVLHLIYDQSENQEDAAFYLLLDLFKEVWNNARTHGNRGSTAVEMEE